MGNIAKSENQDSINFWRIVNLRYFNPVGAHETSLIGEEPNGEPNNLFPYVCQVASGQRPVLPIFGNDYNTRDGTGIRDYIHVMDLAEGHVAAISLLKGATEFNTINLGTGVGYSVLEIIEAFEKASGSQIPYQFCPRRAGDVEICFADITQAKNLLGWEARFGLNEMCSSAWKYRQSANALAY